MPMELGSVSAARSSVEKETKSGTMAGVGKCFLVTGPPGVGKTTLIMRIYETLKLSNPNLKLQGFYSQEIRQGGERVGFEVVTLDGRRGRLACSILPSPEARQWPAVGKYKVDIASFEAVALPELKVREDTDLFIIDEVGKMELYSSYFFPAILNILQSNIPLLATVPIPKFGKDIPAVVRLKNHPGATIFTLDQSNRDAMKEQIYSQLVDMLPKPLD
ncbi:cancer-related nucleoside-triphosphatase [Durio zibethinus]|uniref:Cancer-related nucleoside-triphosphatase n=1 Tax=Durio zibethinus TaxID=66656 RepID=A0A6P5YKK2_DURZI|nr:cancer-related nucleoside-triphosphatase [Durio zibethinus]